MILTALLDLDEKIQTDELALASDFTKKSVVVCDVTQ
jgi:hypothetical protein